MPSSRLRPANRIKLTFPVLLLVFAATAIPIEFAPPGATKPELRIQDVPDIVANVAGYVPVGVVLGELGVWKAVLAAGLLSGFAEASQSVMMHRDPSLIDVVSNVAGATLGSLASVFWKIGSPTFRISRWRGVLAALCVFPVILWARAMSGDPINARGDRLPGTLEAAWKFDESRGRLVLDASGHQLTGKFSKEPPRVSGEKGTTPVFDGANDVDFGHSTELRLAGSMTISAWINSSAYPFDDAAIVSQLHSGRGYQLDTTVDRGPRTIGFKLTNACGKLMARYGATPLELGRWYHIAGVYDAAAQTLDVYLNGALDNGFLVAPVSGVQRSSRGAVFAGKRGDAKQFNFSGSLHDVRVYSFALTGPQIAADMRGEVVHAPETQRVATDRARCAPFSDPEDKEIPLAAAALGMLVAVACIGIWPSAARLLVLGIGAAAGLALLTVTAPGLPAFNNWMVPLISLAGAASVVASAAPKHP